MTIMSKARINLKQTIILLSLMAFGAGCTVVGPDYARPEIDVPSAYKGASQSKGRSAQVTPTTMRWWEIYGDEQLNILVDQVVSKNLSLQIAEARLRRAQVMLEAARASQSPSIFIGGTNDLGLVANWEVDLWGRIKRTVEASGANAEATAADLAAATLSMQAQVAQNYFQLRVQDEGIRVLKETITAYEKLLKMARNQYAVGVTSRASVAQVQAQLGVVQAQMYNAMVGRAQIEHAIAVMIGKAPADFSIAAAPLDVKVPEVPPSMPVDLLERRPDIAAAERRMAATNAQIGAAQATAYPALDLFAGASIAKGWLGGSKVLAPLYLQEAPQSKQKGATASYEEAVADYRQTVLNGFREVEDNLVTLEILGDAAAAQVEAVNAAHESVRIVSNQYRAGIVSYLNVVAAQNVALDSDRAALEILGRRLIASVNLIKALGGGWEVDVSKANKN
jgi:NodT family efflux transporter outer membrane factor (OMF) lipoprotein